MQKGPLLTAIKEKCCELAWLDCLDPVFLLVTNYANSALYLVYSAVSKGPFAHALPSFYTLFWVSYEYHRSLESLRNFCNNLVGNIRLQTSIWMFEPLTLSYCCAATGLLLIVVGTRPDHCLLVHAKSELALSVSPNKHPKIRVAWNWLLTLYLYIQQWKRQSCSKSHWQWW